MTSVIIRGKPKLEKVNKPSQRYFDVFMTVRISKDMRRMIDYWVNNPDCVDDYGNKIFDNRSHFVKSSVIRHLQELKKNYSQKDSP